MMPVRKMIKHDESKREHLRRCPICGKPASQDYRPFCSRRCSDLDLARWLKGGYAIPDDPAAESPEPKEET